jgi:hypothetical protein
MVVIPSVVGYWGLGGNLGLHDKHDDDDDDDDD